MKKITDFEIEIFQFLNRTRELGSENMFGVAPLIVREFGVEMKEAKEILVLWMKNFNEDGYDHLKK